MAIDDFFEIVRKAFVKRGGRGVLFGEAERLRKQANMGLRGTNDSHGASFVSDDDLATSTYPSQQSSEVAGGLRFRDVNDVLRHRRHYIATGRGK